ncbi:non-reducing end alpha-L-arabinofuranosidase family hydrolase [Actinoplanes derwentensis]|uniref:non-reducing end alpha-L-arabinofuranosidase n=1 Tax=Actinoplanes derwentensis TaxID=113562 RepID=A0A1H1XGQ0_9ACTN|nr:non-reducing end alpha-L-arabinofuranosidase family hydrolase [Actinoplanes derwentensis]GID87176.1 hypothetical protein Ade03nite_61000 [Actinoplanes derwentensis]SDT08311.1 Glycosyl hydrolase family 62 [Actinoplanes derwentensis]
MKHIPHRLWLAATAVVALAAGVIVTANPAQAATMQRSYQWSSSGILIAPKSDSSHSLVSIKDPSVVHYNGRWHVFASTVDSAGEYSMVYLNFTDWSSADSATPFHLDETAIGTGYRAAPQVFYFAPQSLWYLVYQTGGNASYSTNTDLANPSGWTAPKGFYSGVPSIIQQNIGSGSWVDMWVICGSVNCHLFSSDNNGHLYRSQTSMAGFPNGMSDPVIVLSDSKFKLFEASNMYKIAGAQEYLLLVEAIGSDGKRYFRSWTTDAINGAFTALADTGSNPFARSTNVAFGGTAWTKDISHGEMIRAGYDQNMIINPCGLRYAYQGFDPASTAGYTFPPWRIGLLTQTNSAC